MLSPSAPVAANPGWLRRLFDRGHLRGVGTTLGVVFGLPFGVILGFILGGDWARLAGPDLADAARYGGLLVGLTACVAAGGLVGSGVGGVLTLLRVPDGGRARTLAGALTGALVCSGGAAALGLLMQEAADLRSWTTVALVGGAVLGALVGWALRVAPARKAG
jgi:hypothetical protein